MALSHLRKTPAFIFTGHFKTCLKFPLMGLGFGRNNSAVFSILRTKSTKSSSNSEEDLDEPIKFSTSEASKWTAHKTHRGRPDDMPACQPFVVSISTAIFIIYFLVLREENDMDEEIAKPLWEKIPGLEKQQLLIVLEYNEQNNLPTEDILKRLHEIDPDFNRQENTT